MGVTFCQTFRKYLSLVDKPRLPFIWWYIKFPRWSIEESSVFVGARSLWNASTARIERKGNNWFERYTHSKSTPKSGWTSEEKTVLPVYTAYVIAKKRNQFSDFEYICELPLSMRVRLKMDSIWVRTRGGGGNSHMKQTGMLVGNFEFNP